VQANTEISSTAIINIVDVLQGYWPLPENIVNPTVIPRFPLTVRS
jgi:hypothetical protein